MDSNKASYPELIISPFARVLTFVAKLCAALFSLPLIRGCAGNQNVRKDLLRGFCNRCTAPIRSLSRLFQIRSLSRLFLKPFFQFQSNSREHSLVELTKGVAAASSGFLIISHHWLGKETAHCAPSGVPSTGFLNNCRTDFLPG